MTKNNWISVNERLPDELQDVLVFASYWHKTPFVARLYEGNKWWGEQILSSPYGVTHWQPLPAPPSC